MEVVLYKGGGGMYEKRGVGLGKIGEKLFYSSYRINFAEIFRV